MANVEKYYLYKLLRDSADGYLKSGNLLVPTEETKYAEKKEYEINPKMLEQYEKVANWVADVDNRTVSGIVKTQLEKGVNITAFRNFVDGLIEERNTAGLSGVNSGMREIVSPVTEDVKDPFTSKFTKQARMYMLGKYFGNKSSEDIKNMTDEEFLTCYVSMQNHVKRVSTCNDILHSALLKDSNYPQFIKDQELMEGRSRHEKKEVKKAIIKSRKEFKKESQKASQSKKGGLRDFFTTNKTLRIIEGFDPIPPKYKEKAIDSLLKAIEKAKKGNGIPRDIQKKYADLRQTWNGPLKGGQGPATGPQGGPTNPAGGEVPVNDSQGKDTGETNTGESNTEDAEEKIKDPNEELRESIKNKERVLNDGRFSATVGTGQFTNRCILSCDDNGNNIKYVDYFEIPDRPGRFIVSAEKTVENGRKTKGFKMSKKDIANVQNSMREGVIKFKSNSKDLKEVEFVMAGKDSAGRQLYQSYESFKTTSPYISSVIFENEFIKFNNNEVKNSAEIVSKVDIMRKFVDYGDNPTREQVQRMEVVNDYLDFAINPNNPKFNVMRADVEKHEKAFNEYKKNHPNVSESLAEFSFAKQNEKQFEIERMGERCKQSGIPRMEICEDANLKDGDKVLEYCGLKFNFSGITTIGVDKDKKPIMRRYFENPAYPGLIMLGKTQVDLPDFDVINQSTETKIKSGCVTIQSANLGRAVEFARLSIVDEQQSKNQDVIVSLEKLRTIPENDKNYVLSQIYADRFKEFVNDKYAKYEEPTKQTFIDVPFNKLLDEFASTVVPFKDDVNARKDTIAEINGKENVERVFEHERVRELDRVYDIYERMSADTKESKTIVKDINNIVNSGKNYLNYQKYVNEHEFSDKQLAKLSFIIENGLEPESFVNKNEQKEMLENAKKVGKELEKASIKTQDFYKEDVLSEFQKDIEPKVYNLSEKETEQIMTPKFSVSDLERSQSGIDMQYESTSNEFGKDSYIDSERNRTLNEKDPKILSNEDYLKQVEEIENADKKYESMAFTGGMDENADNETIKQQKAEYDWAYKPYKQSSTSTIDGVTATANNIYSADNLEDVQADYNVEVEDKENTAIDDMTKATEEIQTQGLNANYVFDDKFVKDIAEKVDEEIEKDRYTNVEEIQFDEKVLDELRGKAHTVVEEEPIKDMDAEQNDGGAVVEEEPVVEEGLMQMPSGINDLAVDALWKDIYKTLSVKDENGKDIYNIGSTTMDILKCASGEPVEIDPRRAVKIKEILTKTYKNHTLRSLIDNKGISKELQAELEKFGVDMEKCKIKGELNNELLSYAFAEKKYQEICKLVSSEAGLSRVALFELSQGKYNPNGGKDDDGKLVEDHRRDSWFYRALCKSNIEFDIEKYKEIVTDMVNNQVNVVDVTDPNAKQVELETPNGSIRVVEVEVNGVKVYVDKSVNPPKVVETQDIVQNAPNGKPLVKMDDVLNAVAYNRAMSQNVMPKYQKQARANVDNYANITKATGNEEMER